MKKIGQQAALLLAIGGILWAVFFWGMDLGTQQEDQLNSSVSEAIDISLLLVYEKQQKEINVLRQEIYRLEIENTNTKKLLEESGQIQCSPVQILIRANEEMAQYGVSGLVTAGETEICGYNMNVTLRAWGPSIVAYLDSLKESYADLQKEMEYYKALYETAQREKSQP